MKGLINLFVHRRVTVVMIIAAQIIAAFFSFLTLPINRLPDFSVPRVTVETVFSGMAAGEIRSMVTIPLEDGFSPIKGLEKMRSVSRDNYSIISMDFRWGTDPMTASVLVREAIDAVYPSLPEGVRKPTVTSGDSSNEPHAVIAVSQVKLDSLEKLDISPNSSGEFARKLAEYELRARLRRIDGVGSVILVGGDVAEERLSLDALRLAAIGLVPSEFADLLAKETADIPAGNAREGNSELVVVNSGKPETSADLSRIILPAGESILRVADSGELNSVYARRESVFVYNGKEAAALEIYRRPGSDPLRLSREIKKTLEEAVSFFSRDAQIELVTDSTPSLITGIKSLLISASLGAAAVFFVLFIFIRRMKYSMLASLSIPVSAAAGICVLSLMGKSLNNMSLGGLAMGIGLVSDISVIVLDLLHKSFGNRVFGKIDTAPEPGNFPTPEEIADKASSIAGSSIASTLTTALVFVPIILLPGPLGSLFGDIAIALTASITAGWFYAQFCLPSLYYALTFVLPASRSHLTCPPARLVTSQVLRFFRLKPCKPAFFGGSCTKTDVSEQPYSIIQKIVKRMTANILNTGILAKSFYFKKKYKRLLSVLLRSPARIFTTAAILVAVGVLILFLQPMGFINPDDAQEVLVSVVFPPGTMLETAGEAGKDISYVLSRLPSVKTVYGRAGAEEEDSGRRADIDYRREEIILRCILEKEVKPLKALAEIKKAVGVLELSDKTGQAVFSVYFPKDRTEVLLGLSSQRSFVIKGGSREELLERTAIARNIFNNAKVDVNFRPRGQRPELRFYTNREAAAYLSISASQIAETLFILNEGVDASRLETGGRPLYVRVTGQNDYLSDPVRRLENVPLRSGQGKTVFLGSIGRIERREAEASLARLDRSDVIYADITAAGKLPLTVNETAARFSWFTGADDSAFSRYRISLIVYVLLVLVLLYMTMGAQFESFLLPLILMMSIPFSLAGAGPALLITGAMIDSGAVLGLTALFGLVVNNSLVLFEISDEKIKAGKSSVAAVYEGACERLQAILITTATTVFALLPLVLSPLGNSQKSMAAAMLGGLAASTLLSLFAIPPVLIIFFNWKTKHSLTEHDYPTVEAMNENI